MLTVALPRVSASSGSGQWQWLNDQRDEFGLKALIANNLVNKAANKPLHVYYQEPSHTIVRRLILK